MATPDPSDPSHSIPLSMSRECQWTLHHVLLDRIERETSAVTSTPVEPPSVEVFRAFERLDAGETRFTVAQLEAVQSVLTEYHHATTWWELERARIERLLHRVSTALEEQGSSPSTESIRSD